MNCEEQTHLSWAKNQAAQCKFPAPGEVQELSASAPLWKATQAQAGIPAECLHSTMEIQMEMSSGPHISGKFHPQSLLCPVVHTSRPVPN